MLVLRLRGRRDPRHYTYLSAERTTGVGHHAEAENASTEETAFVQVKSQASQAVLDDYVSRFSGQRDHYDRMIFAVHDCEGTLTLPEGLPVHVWSGQRIAQLMVKHGLGDWIAKRV
jgi:hypothetical protein